ncbi:MAG: hypothetical protein WCF54_01305, partial [Terracidiphilus sp.]
QKEPHPESLGALDGHQAHLPADMVAVLKEGHLRLIELGVFFQAGDALFDAAAEAGADLKIFTDCTVGHHGGSFKRFRIVKGLRLGKKILRRAKVFPICDDITHEE